MIRSEGFVAAARGFTSSLLLLLLGATQLFTYVPRQGVGERALLKASPSVSVLTGRRKPEN